MTQVAVAQAAQTMNGKFSELPKELAHSFVLSSYQVGYAFVEHNGASVLVALYRNSNPQAAKNGVPYAPPSIEYIKRCMWNDAGVEQVKPRDARLPQSDDELVELLERFRSGHSSTAKHS